METMFDLAASVEDASVELERIKDLINIVVTEVFDKCAPQDKMIYGALGQYEHSFESVLSAASEKALNQIKKLDAVAKELYEKSKKEVN